MQKNHEKISLQYDATQKKLKQRLDKILDEKKAWESEKRMLLTKNGFDQELVNLNVGGTHKVTVSQKVLQLVKNSHSSLHYYYYCMSYEESEGCVGGIFNEETTINKEKKESVCERERDV